MRRHPRTMKLFLLRRSLRASSGLCLAAATVIALHSATWAAGLGEAVIVRIKTASGVQERIGIIMGQNGNVLKVRIYDRSANGVVSTSFVNVYSSQVRPIDTESANRILSSRQPTANPVAAPPARPVVAPRPAAPAPARPAPSAQGTSSLAGTFQQIIRRQLLIGTRPKQATFESFSVGAPYSYRFNNLAGSSPDGPFGRLGTTVYPVKTTYVVKESYVDADEFVRKTRNYSCFVSVNNEWICNMTAGGAGDQFWRAPR